MVAADENRPPSMNNELGRWASSQTKGHYMRAEGGGDSHCGAVGRPASLVLQASTVGWVATHHRDLGRERWVITHPTRPRAINTAAHAASGHHVARWTSS